MKHNADGYAKHGEGVEGCVFGHPSPERGCGKAQPQQRRIASALDNFQYGSAFGCAAAGLGDTAALHQNKVARIWSGV